MNLIRGFKTRAEQLAQEVRRDLGLRPTDPLDPVALATRLGTFVMPIEDLVLDGATPKAIHRLQSCGEFSAATLTTSRNRLILYNSREPLTRLANSLTHELSHLLLAHEAAPALDDLACRIWNTQQEEEANWLAATLLVPRSAALQIVRSDLSLADAARVYGVSVRLMGWRLNTTGAFAQVARERARRNRLGKVAT